MERTCERAIEIGLPAIAFTDHYDLVAVHRGQHPVHIDGYLECVDRCRSMFPSLRILTGIEIGEPHWFPLETKSVLDAHPLEQVLGSMHCVNLDGGDVDASQFRLLEPSEQPAAVDEFFRQTLAMVESGLPFGVIGHLDYLKRYWPDGLPPYTDADHEVELRAILSAAARTGRVLEINTTRNDAGVGRFCPGPQVLRWWYESGGGAVSFGSDTHSPDAVAAGFDLAAQLVEAAGFKPSEDPAAYWRR
jgi:histidinol-phosphatase (PHP family)